MFGKTNPAVKERKTEKQVIKNTQLRRATYCETVQNEDDDRPIMVYTSTDIPGVNYSALGLVIIEKKFKSTHAFTKTNFNLGTSETLTELREKAREHGADGIIGFSIGSEVLPDEDHPWVITTAYGTAVKFI